MSQFLKSSLSVLLFVWLIVPQQALAAKGKKVKSRLIAGNYVVGGVLQQVDGNCNLLNTSAIVGSSLSMSVSKNTVTVNSFSSLVGKLKRNGKYKAEGVADLTPTISFVSEELDGKFTYNKKKKRVTFKGTYSVETTLSSQRDCFAEYLIRYRSVQNDSE